MVPFTDRIHEALDFAAIHHKGQVRKDPDLHIPYVSHLFGVAYILASYDFPENVVVAGVLHDFIEDVVQRKRKPKLEEEMTRTFGEYVHGLVGFVTQRKVNERGWPIDWHTRGEAYRAVMANPATPYEALAISCADKIHNIGSLLIALDRRKGKEQKMWKKLKATPEEQMEKFRLLHETIASRWSHPIVDELRTKIDLLSARMPT